MAEEKKKRAIPTLVRGPDGLMHTVYVDAETGQVLPSLNGYTVLSASSGQYYTPDGTPSSSENEENLDEEETPKIIQRNSNQPPPEGVGRSGAVDQHGYKYGTPNNNPTDNFGYISKPAALKYAGFLPGIVGGVAKVANMGINLNNMDSVDKARKGLGLKSTKTNIGSVAKGALKDNKGQVSNNAKIGNKTYSIGFEALSPDKKTNLTFNEAKLREALARTPITEPEQEKTKKTPETKKESRFSKITGIQPGFAKRALDKIFGVSEETPETTPTPTEKPSVGPTTYSPADEKGVRTITDPSGKVVGTTTPTGVGFVSSFGVHRPNMPKADIVDAVKDSVAKTFGPGYSVVGISGTEGEDNPQYGSPRHKTGLALDFDVTDPTGQRVTDVNALNDMAAGFAFDHPEAGIGFGQGYMAPGRMHLDLSGLGKNWGAGNTVRNMDPALAETIDAARQGFQPTPFSNPGVPTARPNPNAPQAFVSQDERPSIPSSTSLNPIGKSLDPLEHKSIFDQISPTASVGQQVVAQNVQQDMTPARMASMGFITRTPEQKQAIAQAIAGELGPKSLAGLVSGDPIAKTELANIAATIENRAQSKMFSSLQEALNPTSYNSLQPSNMPTTLDNNRRYSAALQSTLDDFYSGKITPTSYDVTSYVNPNAVKSMPSWATQMENPTQVGAHLFGTLPEYGPNKQAQAAMKALETMSGTGLNPGKVADDRFSGVSGYSGQSGVNSLDTPSETSGVGRGSAISSTPSKSDYSGLGGLDSPSERSGVGRGSSLAGDSRSSSYSGYGGLDSPSERSGVGRGGSLNSGSSPSRGYSGYGGLDSPSESSGVGRGSSLGGGSSRGSSGGGGYSGLGGSNSPSEGGGRFGGSGLGSPSGSRSSSSSGSRSPGAEASHSRGTTSSGSVSSGGGHRAD